MHGVPKYSIIIGFRSALERRKFAVDQTKYNDLVQIIICLELLEDLSTNEGFKFAGALANCGLEALFEYYGQEKLCSDVYKVTARLLELDNSSEVDPEILFYLQALL